MIVRVYRGVADHFPLRLSEWVMVWPSLGMWVALHLDPHMFSTSRSFSTVAMWFDEGSWALIFATAGVCRLGALTINGTFQGFRLSPHIRAGASVVGALMWSQLTLGFLDAYLTAGGALSGVVMYSTPVILEVINIFRSWADIPKQARA